METFNDTRVLSPNPYFSQVASEARINKAAEALKANGIEAIVVQTGEEAKAKVLELLPEGAEIYNTTSRTLDTIGLASDIEQSGTYQAVRPRLWQFDRTTQANEARKFGAAPDYVVGSVHAITEQGQAIIASLSGSQIGVYASGGGTVIWVVGAQKIVRDLEEGLRRIEEYSYPLEDARAREAYGIGSGINKVLIVNREFRPGRITAILVKENLGF